MLELPKTGHTAGAAIVTDDMGADKKPLRKKTPNYNRIMTTIPCY
jgi:hypothetical protein